MKKTIALIIGFILLILIAINIFNQDDIVDLQLEKLKQTYAVKPIPSVDHRKLPELQKEFKSPQEVTEVCISCHTETPKEVMASAHWNWERAGYIEGRGIKFLGKKNVVNNYCIGSKTNEQACAKCHIGFGMTNNDEFNYKDSNNVDCMVCHDNSETYQKGASLAGYPDREVNLEKVAQSVGMPKKSNCGSCHFYSGGGNNVKHGDLEEAQLDCSREVDVHMASNGLNLECIACHTATNHQIKGRLYSVSSDNENRANCEDCHTSTPHFATILNTHTARIACQTCHIPEYAKVNATKMDWKWSTAGIMKNGEPYETEDSVGNHDYMTIKGSFVWKKNVKPDYVWFNGTANHHLVGDQITSIPIQINALNGSYTDKYSKIIPVKINTGDQIYDKKYNYLIIPKLYAPEKGDSAYWADFDWNTASEAGMKRIGLPYSGSHGFVSTVMYWPLNHMVAPKDKSVSCAECHTRNNGRLAHLSGFYMPGRDRSARLDFLGRWLVILSVVGVVIHNSLRILSAYRRKKIEMNIINYNTNDDDSE